jgi:hypothetical protein
MARLKDLALEAMTAALLQGRGPCTIGSLSVMPVEMATVVLGFLSKRLGAGPLSPSPPIEVLRLFYGSRLERLRQSGATDEWAEEALGVGLRRLVALSLPGARLTEYGVGQMVAALPELSDLSISRCTGMAAAPVLALLGQLERLERLSLVECALSIDASALAPLLALRHLALLDLGGNLLDSGAVRTLCEGREGAAPQPLRTLRLWGSQVDDAAAVSLMQLPQLDELSLGWTPLTGVRRAGSEPRPPEKMSGERRYPLATERLSTATTPPLLPVALPGHDGSWWVMMGLTMSQVWVS